MKWNKYEYDKVVVSEHWNVGCLPEVSYMEALVLGEKLVMVSYYGNLPETTERNGSVAFIFLADAAESI